NHALVQFDHRMTAYLVILVAILHAVDARLAGQAGVARRATGVAVLALAQAGLGIATLLLAVPLWAALAHQVLAMAILTMATVHARLSRGSGRVQPAAAGLPLGFEGLAGRGI
ncbi:MAG: COX15/CtaA family protein, partial [Parafilimonas terrae]|nr:COX15/CtaA family protein [Parafilimonas terrae]